MFGLNLPFGGYIISAYMIYDFISFFYLVYEDAISRAVFSMYFYMKTLEAFEEFQVRFVRNDATWDNEFLVSTGIRDSLMEGCMFQQKNIASYGGAFLKLAKLNPYGVIVVMVVMLEDVIWQGNAPPSCE